MNRRFWLRVTRRLAGPVARLHRRADTELRKGDAARAAQAQLARLEALFGRPPAAALRRAAEYAEQVLGSADYARQLAAYTVIAGEFREGWIPSDYRWHHVDRVAAGHLRTLSRIKTATRRLLPEAPLPDIGTWSNGSFLDARGRVLSEAAFRAALFAEHPRAIFKADATGQGDAILVLDADRFDAAAIRRHGSGVFQRFLRQHPRLAALSPGPVATLRIVTWLGADGTATTRGAYLRVGRARQSHVVSSDSIRCAVDLDGGRLVGRGYGADWTPHATHPDTGERFDGYALPGLAEARALAEGLHAACPLVRLVGWDFAVEEDGAVALMEWNFQPALTFLEAVSGPCFAGLGWETYWREAQGA
jgi:hypothetical protein